MKFHSDAEMLMHYIRELLADGQEYTIAEIREYVFEQTNQVGANGKPITIQQVNNALHYMNNKLHELYKVRKCVYQSVQHENASKLESFQKNALNILEQCVKSLEHSYQSNIKIPDISANDTVEMRQYGLHLIGELSQIKDSIKVELKERQETYAGSVQPELDNQQVSDGYGQRGMELGM